MKKSKNPAYPIMIQGTSSHVGKSILVAAICRILKDNGLKVAPFKAQNMALNSFAAKDGGEMGRAQVFQAEAAGIEPTVDMNPILLKPTSDMGSQVIIHGKIYGNMNAKEYHKFKKEAKKYVIESYKRLAEEYDVIVIEGAGSPAEINLRENDIANMGLAEMVDSPVILAGDIDRGGVFASLVGTMELLSNAEKQRVKGFIINKFRGDFELLKAGLDFLEHKTGLPVLGVVPYLKDIILPDEDGVVLERVQGRVPIRRMGGGSRVQEKINISIIKLPRISNFTDFDAFKHETDIVLRYVSNPEELDEADVIIIPGSKNTLEDLKWLWDAGIANKIINYAKNSGRVIGICGGFQMLGRCVNDPYGMESSAKKTKGLGLLDMETILEKEKNTYQVEAEIKSKVKSQKSKVKGYEIHMGETNGREQSFSVITIRNNRYVKIHDGAISDNGKIWGTYIHGIFDNDEFRTGFLNEVRAIKRLPVQQGVCFKDKQDVNIKALAEVVKNSIDMIKMLEICGLKTIAYTKGNK
ncbi:MAG: cobyric acid synthase [Deltaproteobacteria bacterium]|nr:cobyric acid synthase [Deltaproteobacteria bacterium]